MNETVPRKSDDWAVALVHGIGITDRLKMIQEVCHALSYARPEMKLGHGAEIHEVREIRDKDGNITEQETEARGEITGPLADSGDTYVRHNVIRNGRLGDGTFRIGTAHWADITYYRQGLVNLIGALMMTAFGVRFFAEVAAKASKDDNWVIKSFSWVQRRLLKLMVQILALFVFPVTFVSLIFSCMSLIGIYVFRTQLAGAQKEFIAISSLALCIAAAIVGVRRSWEFRKERPLAVSLFLVIAGVALVIAIAMLFGDRLWIAGGVGIPWQFHWQEIRGQAPGSAFLPLPLFIRDMLVWIASFFRYVELADRIMLVDETAAYFALLHALQLVAGIVLLFLTFAAGVNLTLLFIVFKLTGRTSRTFVFATVSVITIWIVNLVLLWPENLATFAAMTLFLDDTRLKETITITGVNWSQMKIETLTIGLGDPVEFRPGFMNKRLYSETYPVMWFEAMFLVFLSATLLLVLSLPFARFCWNRFHKNTPLAAFAPAAGKAEPRYASWPRLIISGGYVLLVLVLIFVVPTTLLAVVVGAVAKAIGLGIPLPIVDWIILYLPNDLTVGAEWARIGVLLFLILFLFFSQYIRDGAKLLLDVVNHFTPRTRSASETFRGRKQRELIFPVRRRIQQRFEEMIEALLSRGDKPNLLIVAHSQGTVITLDALMRRRWMSRLLDRVESVTVITFGSPITHVYQRYFPQLYKPFGETPHLVELSRDSRVRWINVYRIDDFVGTYIENSIPGFPINVPVPAGGHTNYWSADVMKELFHHPELQDVLVAHQHKRPGRNEGAAAPAVI